MSCPVAHSSADAPPPVLNGVPKGMCPVAHTSDGAVPAGHPAVAPARPSLESSSSSDAASSSSGVTTPDEDDEFGDLDYSGATADLLREGTKRAHTKAENSDGAVALTQGQLELQEYVRWLAILWRVYDALERGLDLHAQHPVLAPTYNPELLRRADTLAADIKFLLNRLPAWSLKPSGRKHGIKAPFPMPAFIEEVFVSTPPRLARYLDRINALSGDERKCPLLLAHAYVRYLGDLSGGQIIGAKLRRAYGLDGLDGRRFYFFDLSDDTSAAVTGEETVGDRKKKLVEVKNWYRRGMNQGGGDDRELKKALVREANDAFLLNTDIFQLINPPPRAKVRYFEKKQREEQRRRDLNPRPVLSVTDHALRFAAFLVCALVGLYAVQAASPYAEPYVKPVVDKIVDRFEEAVVPWWIKNEDLLRRIAAKQRRFLL